MLKLLDVLVQLDHLKNAKYSIPNDFSWYKRILSDMRTLSADWMANTSKGESYLQSSQHGGEENIGNFFFPRAVAPTAARVHCLRFLIYEMVSGGNMRKPGGLFGNSSSDIPANDLKQLETF